MAKQTYDMCNLAVTYAYICLCTAETPFLSILSLFLREMSKC